MISNLSCLQLATGGISMAHQKEGRTTHCGAFIQLLCLCLFFLLCLLQLPARLDLLHEHPRFAPPPSLSDPEKPASFTPPTLRGHIADFNAVLSGSDQYLARHVAKEEPEEFSFSPFAELGTRSIIPEEPVESLHYQKESPMSFGDIGDFKISIKVLYVLYLQI